MANINTTARPKATVESSTSPTIYNVSCLLSGTEYSQLLNNNTKQILIRARNASKVNVAFIATNTSTLFITVNAGCSLVLDALLFSGTVYVSCSKNNEIVEILEWT